MPRPLTPAERRELESHRVAHLATADGQGRPHLVPIAFAIAGEAIVSVIDEKPKRVHGTALRRIQNILVNPRVAFLVDRYDDDWERLAYTMVRGHAEVLAAAGPEYDTAITALRARYVQYRDLPLAPVRNPVVRIWPERVHHWRARRASAAGATE
jgi:PPOX class probable F420-dependent enzyme